MPLVWMFKTHTTPCINLVLLSLGGADFPPSPLPHLSEYAPVPADPAFIAVISQ